MDALTLRQILREEIAVVQETFAGELAAVKRSMSQQTADLTSNYRADLLLVRQEQQSLRAMVHTNFEAVQDMMRHINVDGSRPSTTTSQQTFTSHGGEIQQLPDDYMTGNVAAWDAQAGAPSWAPDTDNLSAAPTERKAQASGGARELSVPMVPPDQERNRKTCILCSGRFKHKRGARQHMMKAFKPNALCKFVTGYAPHESILIPFQQAVAPGTAPEAVWKLAVKTIMRRSA